VPGSVELGLCVALEGWSEFALQEEDPSPSILSSLSGF
jgi:hypothetical protein